MTAQIVANFIEDVWNKRSLHLAEAYLHPDFIDHSLPRELTPDTEGLKKWVALTSASFEHHTVIEDQVTEGDKSIVKVILQVKHTGTWRGIPATLKEVSVAGYRLFWLKEDKIVEHWALIDGNSLEKQL